MVCFYKMQTQISACLPCLQECLASTIYLLTVSCTSLGTTTHVASRCFTTIDQLIWEMEREDSKRFQLSITPCMYPRSVMHIQFNNNLWAILFRSNVGSPCWIVSKFTKVCLWCGAKTLKSGAYTVTMLSLNRQFFHRYIIYTTRQQSIHIHV